MKQTDLALLQRFVQAGDSDAFAEIVGRHRDFVYSTCVRILGNPTTAEDASQECFLRLVRKADAVQSSVGGWLHRCATDVAIDEVRRGALRKNKEGLSTQMNRSSNDEPAWHDLAPHLDKAVEELPDDLRVVVVEHFLQRRTQSDIAKELGVSAMTVSRRIDSGIDELRKNLKRAGVIVSGVLLASLVSEHAVCAAPASLAAALGKVILAGAVKTKTAAGITLLGAAKVKLLAAALAAAVATGAVVHLSTGEKGAADPAANVSGQAPEEEDHETDEGGAKSAPAEDIVTQPIRTFGLGSLSKVAYSPDGRHIATCGGGGAFLWDVETGKRIRAFKGHTETVSSVAFSPDGTRLLTGSFDKTAKLWDVATGECIRTLTGDTSLVLSVAFSPDGMRVVTGSWDGTAMLWPAGE